MRVMVWFILDGCDGDDEETMLQCLSSALDGLTIPGIAGPIEIAHESSTVDDDQRDDNGRPLDT